MPMKRLALVTAGAILLTGMLVMPASAQEERCRNDTIKAAGKATILGKGRARRLAIDNWQREVRQKYGERYMDFSKSREARFECEAASIGAIGKFNQRCSVSAYPCRISAAADDATFGQDDDRAAFTIQRLLRRAGYLDRDDVDGEYGPRTRQAVRRFQRDERLRVTGEADERTLERLRRAAKGG